MQRFSALSQNGHCGFDQISIIIEPH